MNNLDIVKLGDLCSVITKGTTPTTIGYKFQNSGINFVKIESISDNGTFILDKLEHISDECNQKMKRSQLFENDILFSIAGAIGKIGYVTKDILPANTNQALAIIRLNSKKILHSYLMYCLKSNIIMKQYDKNKQGVAQINLSLKNISDLQIHLPTLENQKQISENLDKVIRLIDLCNTILEKLDLLVKARFVEMFGNPDFNPKGWIEYALSEKIDVIGGYAFKSDFFDEEKGIPVLRIGNVNTGYFRPINMVYWHEDNALERYVIYPGDVVMSLTGTVGKDDYGNVCILGNDYDKYYLNQRNAKLEIKEGLDKFYLSHLLKFESIKKRLTGISRGVRQANIANKDILNLVVPIPPLVLQNQFADFAKQTEKSKSSVKKLLEKAETLKKALMQEYFG